MKKTGIQHILPERWAPYAKAWVALLLMVATSLTVVMGSPEWLTIAIAILAPVSVYFQSNETP